MKLKIIAYKNNRHRLSAMFITSSKLRQREMQIAYFPGMTKLKQTQ